MKTMKKPMAFLLVMALLSAMLPTTASGTLNELTLPEFTETDNVWDSDGNLISETTHDLNGAPAMNSRGFCRAEYTWDKNGCLLSENYYGTRGQPVDTEKGYAAAVYTYMTDSNGNAHPVTEDRFAADGRRAQVEGGYSYRRCDWSNTLMVSDEYFDASGRLTRPTGGYAQILNSFSRNNDTVTVTTRYLDANGRPLIGPEGGATVVTVYTAYSVEIKDSELLIEDLLGLEESDEARPTKGFRLLMLSREIYGTDGKVTLGAKHWHRQVNTYDERYNLTRTDYYGADNMPIMGSNGYASVVNAYDSGDRVIRVDYLDRQGEPVKMLNGYASITYTYYSDGRLHTVRYFGADRQRTMITDGYHMAEYEYDGPDWDRRITYYNILDEYTMCKHGYARIEDRYHRARTLTADGKEKWVIYTYDEKEMERYFGPDMKLIPKKAGYAGLTNEYNGYNQVVRTVYRDTEWKPVRNDERQLAIVEYRYAGTDMWEPAVYEA